MINGRQKASVFPEPVNAMPIMSRPENLDGGQNIMKFESMSAHAAGIP